MRSCTGLFASIYWSGFGDRLSACPSIRHSVTYSMSYVAIRCLGWLSVHARCARQAEAMNRGAFL